MPDVFEDIDRFHKRFGFEQPSIPQLLPPDLQSFREGFLIEEIEELREAYDQRDLVKVADALTDLLYVTLGTMWMMGLPSDEIWNLVHAANMTKIRATNAGQSKRNSPYDVVKPEGFIPPDRAINQLLKQLTGAA